MILSKFTNKKRRSWSCRLRSRNLPHNFMAIVIISFIFIIFQNSEPSKTFWIFLWVSNWFLAFVSRLLAGRKWKEIEFNDSFTAVFLSISGELPNLRIPFHTVFKLTPIAYGKYVTHGGFVCPAWCKEPNARKRSTTALPQNPAVLFSWGWLLFLGLQNFDMTQLVDNLWYHGWPIAPYFWVEISAL